MDDPNGLPEDRFKALLGRAVRHEDGERLSKLRAALRISPNDAVRDVMIALDYHLQLYNAVPKEIARETDKAVLELRGLVDAVRRQEKSGHGEVARSVAAPTVISPAAVAVSSDRDRVPRTLHHGWVPHGRPGPAALGSEAAARCGARCTGGLARVRAAAAHDI